MKDHFAGGRPDPTMEGVGTNRYAYAENDPINKSDPNGHYVEGEDDPQNTAAWAESTKMHAGESLKNGEITEREYLGIVDQVSTELVRSEVERRFAKGDLRGLPASEAVDAFQTLGIGGSAAAGSLIGVGALNGKAAGKPASSSKEGDLLGKHLRAADKYGKQGFKELENGRFRYYGDVAPANTAGEMVGRRLVREIDPANGATRTWHETLDSTGKVRQVRPQAGDDKVHYRFDSSGRYTGKW